MWIFYSLLSPAVYAISNFIDKYLLSKKVKDYNAIPIYTASVSFIFGLIWWLLSGAEPLPTKDGGILILTGIITIFSVILYLKALSTEETSTINLYFQLIPVFTLILAALFLNERIVFKQFIGFVIVLFATIVMGLSGNKKKWHLPHSFYLIVLYDIMFASIGVLLKYVSISSTFSQVIAYESFGMGIGGVLIFIFIPPVRNAFLKTRKRLFKVALPVIVLNEIIFILAKSLGYYAFVLGSASLVSVLANAQVFFALVLGFSLTKLYPSIFKENISNKVLFVKGVSAVLLFIGIYLLV